MQEIATIRGSVEKFNQMLEEGSGGYHEELLWRVSDDGVDTLMQTNGRQVVSYATWSASFFDEVEGGAEAIIPVGGSISDSKGLLDYLQFAGSGTTEFTLLNSGEDGHSAPLATHLKAEGALNFKLRLPSGQDDLDAVPWDHPPRWTPDEQYASKSCLEDDGTLPDDEDEWVTGPSVIETTAAIINEQIIEPAEFADGVEYRPITVEDGEFHLDVEGNQSDDEIWGTVNADRVEGPDISREFKPGFDEVFGVMEGPVRLQTAPETDGGVAPPVTVVQDNYSSRTVRHLLSALADRT